MRQLDLNGKSFQRRVFALGSTLGNHSFFGLDEQASATAGEADFQRIWVPVSGTRRCFRLPVGRTVPALLHFTGGSAA